MAGGLTGRDVAWPRVLGVALATVIWALATGAVVGASPSPATGGDPRSSGQGPGLGTGPAEEAGSDNRTDTAEAANDRDLEGVVDRRRQHVTHH